MKKTLLFYVLCLIGLSSLHAQFTWVEQSTPTSETLNDVFFIDNLTGWAVGNAGTILKTTNGGEVWTALNSGTSMGLRTVFFIDSQVGWAGGNGGGTNRLILKTVDGGANWTNVSFTASSTGIVSDIAFRDNMNGWMCSATGDIWYSDDGGDNWTRETIQDGTMVTRADQLALTPNRTLVGGRVVIDDSGNFIFRPGILQRGSMSMDFIWEQQTDSEMDDDDIIESLFLLNDSVGFAGGTKSKLYKQENSDNINWNLNFTIPNGRGNAIKAISFGNENTGWLLTNSTQGVVFQTTNGGDSWTELPDINQDLFKLFAVDNSVWVVGWRGKIYRNMLSNSVKQINTLSSARLFPNPMTNNLSIELKLEESTHLTMYLYNSLGQQLRQLHSGQFPSGESTLQFNEMDNLPSGAYFLKIQSSDGGIMTLNVMK